MVKYSEVYPASVNNLCRWNRWFFEFINCGGKKSVKNPRPTIKKKEKRIIETVKPLKD
jgi:hypothetical protein